MIELIIAIGVFSAVMYLIILLYLTIGIIRTKTELTAKKPFVSIIVSAHNESQNIAICLDSILHQDYPKHKLELIIVNDRSEDDTGMILDRYKKNYSHINIFNIKDSSSRLRTCILFVEFVVQIEIFLVFGEPALMRVSRIGVISLRNNKNIIFVCDVNDS